MKKYFFKSNNFFPLGTLLTPFFEITTWIEGTYEAAKEEYDSIYDQLYHTHKGEFVKEYPSTCVDYGMKEHYKCKCGKLFLDIECTKEVNSKDLRLELDPDNHSFGEWIIDKEPTGTSEGHMYRVCKCGKKEEKNITKLSGKWVKYSKGCCYDGYSYFPCSFRSCLHL